jgi:hypothetical protein
MSSLLASENSGRLSHPQQRYCACPRHSGPLAVDCCFRRVLELRTLLLPSNLCNGPARFSDWKVPVPLALRLYLPEVWTDDRARAL